MTNGENKVKFILDCLGINYVYNKPLGSDKRRPDFLLEDYKTVIEYQGPHHFIEGYYEKPLKYFYENDLEKHNNLISKGYRVLYASFPEVDKQLEGILPETYIDTLYKTEEELKNGLLKLTNKKIMEKELDKFYCSCDLSFAKGCPQNRNIRPSQVKKILAGLERGEWWKLFYFVVDMETDELIDGHHRLKACEEYIKRHGKLDQPVKYYYLQRPDGVSMPEMIKIFNENRLNISSKDSLRLVEYMGNTAIPKIREFGESHKLTQKKNKKGEVTGYNETITYRLLYGKDMKTEVTNNTISINDQIILDGDRRCNEAEKIISALGLSVCITPLFRPILSSWYDLTVNNDLFKNNFSKTTIENFCNQLTIDSKDWSIGEMLDKDTWNNQFSSVLNSVLTSET